MCMYVCVYIYIYRERERKRALGGIVGCLLLSCNACIRCKTWAAIFFVSTGGDYRSSKGSYTEFGVCRFRDLAIGFVKGAIGSYAVT